VIGIVAMVIWRSQERQDLAKEQLKSAESRAAEIQQALDRLSEANNLIQESHWQADHGLDWAKAHEALTRAVELRPDHSLVWFERAAFYIRLGLWDLAAADYARAVQHQKAITIQHEFFHALLLAYGGQMEAYRHVAVQLPERFPEFLTGVPGGTELARICVLAPVPGANLAWAAEQAESVPWQFRGPWHHNAIALVHYRVGEFERALASAQEARRLDSSWRHRITSDAVLAMAHHRLGHTAQARKALAEAETRIHEWQRFRLERDLGQRWDNWWDVLEGLVLFREAKILIDGSAPLPDSREAILRARALIAIGMEQAATLNAEAWSHVGESYGRSGKPTAAIRAFSRAISLQQDNPRPRLARAQTYIALERWDEAIGDLAAVVELQPNSADAKNRLAWLLATCPDEKLRNPRRAVELAREAVALSASDGNIHNTLGVACYRAGDWNAAVEALQKSANLKRDNVLDEVFLAMAYWRLDRKDEAIKYYRRAIAEKKSDFSLSIQERHDVTRFRAEAKELLMVND